MKTRCMVIGIWVFLLISPALMPTRAASTPKKDATLSFIVTADMRQFAGPRYQTPQYFLGTCEAIREAGPGAFMVSVGDLDPPQHTLDTVRKVLGTNYLWYPVVGNHEAETSADMTWLRDWGKKDIPNLVRKGPRNGEETTYAFDVGEAHFVVLNQYYDGKSDHGADGDITDPLYKWLENDLALNKKPFIFVFGHEPIVSIPDYDDGRMRHKGDNLDAHPENSHRFQQLLRRHKINAYICAHTHNCSFAKINGLWQIDTGHCRGLGDKRVRSTFLKVHVAKPFCRVEIFRDDGKGGKYSLTRTIVLN